jgi:hypothetical protein
MTSADFCNIPPPSVYSFGYFFNMAGKEVIGGNGRLILLPLMR